MTVAAVTTQFLLSDTGAVRERNEDDLLAMPDQGIWAVCDGMGGHDAGDHASATIVSRLAGMQLPERYGSRIRAIRHCLQECNRELIEYARAHGFQHVGSTAIVLCLHDRRASVIWVGDSRAYRLRDGRLRLISRDHSAAEELSDLGLLARENFAGAITRAVGASPRLMSDMVCLESRPGDVWLLCSDGVSSVLDEGEIRVILTGAADPAADLVACAIEAGSRDNCTAVVVRIERHGRA